MSVVRDLRVGRIEPIHDRTEYALRMGMETVPLEAMPVAQ